MTKKLRFGILLVAMSIFTIALMGLFLMNKNTSFAEEEKAQVVQAEILTKYQLGDSLTIPQATLTYSGGSVKADKHKLVAPNGKVYIGSNVSLDQYGEYVLTYLKTVGDKLITGEKKFSVLNKAFSVGQTSSVAYGTNDKLQDVDKLKDVQGLTVKLSAGETFYYNNPIDLRGTTIDNNILTFYSLPNEIGKPDANEIYVRLTDAYNPNNYITIKSGHADYSDLGMKELRFGRSYQCVAAYNQPYTGIRVASSSSLKYEGEFYILEVGGGTGYRSLFSPSAYLGYGEDIGAFKMSMNYAEKIVYGSEKYNINNGGKVIADLDNNLFFTNLWEGFTTGECFLSIYASGYTTSQMEFMITNIKDSSLGSQNAEQGEAPNIEIQEVAGAYAVVGRPFKLYPAVASEVYSGILDYQVEVLYNGNTSVPVKDGIFTPNKAGKYTLKYSAKSDNGKTTEQKVFVVAREQSDITIDFNRQENLKAGATVVFENEKVIGTSGNYTLKMTAKLKDSNLPAYEITGENGKYSFCPLYAGDYEVIYTISDYIGITEKKNIITVGAGNYILNGTPNLPSYFIKNESYVIPSMKCYDLTSGSPVEQDAKVYYQFDSVANESEVNSGRIKITEGDKVKLFYKYNGNLIQSFEIPVVDVGYGSMQMQIYNYFNSKDSSMLFDKAGSSEAYSSYTITGENASMQFIKEIAINSFSLSFKVPNCNFGRLVFDLSNSEQSLKIELVSLGDAQSRVIVNQTEYIMGKNFAKGGNFTVSYSNSTKAVTVIGEGTPYVFVLNSQTFEGFKNNNAYLTITAKDYLNDLPSTINISKLNNQYIVGVDKDDYTAPEIYHNIANGIKRLNNVINLAGIGATDVLYENTVCTYSVYGPDGIATSIEGQRLKDISAGSNYTLALSEYGNYRIVIVATDGIGNEVKNTVNLTVIDDVAPSISLNGETEYRYVDTKLQLKAYSVTDNIDNKENVRIRVMIISPSGVSYNNLEDFILNEVGEYTVMVYAIDSSNNIAQAHYTICVVAGEVA